MIERMRKLTLLLHHAEKEQFLARLRDLGVVHVVVKPDVDSEELGRVRAEARSVERVAAELRRIRKERKDAVGKSAAGDAAEVVRRFDELTRAHDTAAQKIAALAKDTAALEPWGQIEPATLQRLAAAGVRTRFYEVDRKRLAGLALGDVPHAVIGGEGATVRLVVFERGEAVDLGLEQAVLPASSLDQARAALAREQKSLADADAALAELSGSLEILESRLRERRAVERFESVRLSMEGAADGRVLALAGWVPAVREKDLVHFLDTCTAWYELAHPSPGDDVPVLLRQDAFTRLFQPILKVYSLPDYCELDPTAFFAPFFTFFVGLCFADVAYGLVLAIACLVARRKLPPGLRPVAALGAILGFATVFAGVLLNSFFGHTIFGGPGVPEGSAFFPSGAQYVAPLTPVEGERGAEYPMMAFAMVVGVVQVLLGMLLRMVNQWRQDGWKGGMLPVGSAGMLIGVLVLAAHGNWLDLGLGTLVVGPLRIGALLMVIPVFAGKVLLWGGLALFLLFNNLQSRIYWRPLRGLWELYQFVGGVFSNLLSYLRLFALGLSGGLLGAAFNAIAFMPIMKDGHPQYASPLIVVTVLLLVIGHSINFALSAIGSFVHPLRLTFVEFYGNLNFKGGGKAYAPFAQAAGAGK